MFQYTLVNFILAYFTGIFFFKFKSLIFFVLICVSFCYLAKKIKKAYLLGYCFLLGFGLIAIWQQNLDNKINCLAKNLPENCRWVIASDIKQRKNSKSFYLKAQNYLLAATTKEPETNYEYGDSFYLKKPKIIPLKRSANYGLTNYDDYLLSKGICGKIFIQQNNLIYYKKPLFSLPRTIYRLKNYLTDIHRRSLPADYADLLISIIFGDSLVELEETTTAAYRRCGLVHLLVVSGSQIAIIAGLLLSFAKFFKLSNRAGIILISGVLTVFTIAVGAGASIVRAWLTLEISLLALFTGRQKDIPTAIALSAFIASLFNPNVIFDIGFQLSYAATLSLIYLAPLFKTNLLQIVPEKAAGLISMALAPLILTLPFSVFYFNTISLIALPVNIILLFWLEILVISGFLVTILGVFIFPLAKFINIANYLLLSLINKLVFYVNNFSFAVISIRQINILVFLFLIMLIISFAAYFHTNKRKYGLTGYFLLIIILCSLLLARDSDLKITMLDVGQGEAIIIKTPQNNGILLDCGNEKYDPAKNIIIPTLVKAGIQDLDYLILTHEHKDHNSGFKTLINNYRIKTIIGDIPQGLTVNSRNITCLRVTQNAEYKLDGVILKACYVASKDRDISINDTSAVYLLEYNKFKILFTGDADNTAEKYLIKNLQAADVDVLKVAHHGSKTSTSYKFLKYLKPEVALISVGENNKYNLPNQDTLARLEDFSKIYRTDRDGAIEITVAKNGSYKVKSFNSNKK